MTIFNITNITIDINTFGLPAPNIFAWILHYQLKITKADEYWRKMTNMRVIEHRWLLNNTKNTGQQSTSWANTLIFRPSLITLFKAELAVQMYICQWISLKYSSKFKFVLNFLNVLSFPWFSCCWIWSFQKRTYCSSRLPFKPWQKFSNSLKFCIKTFKVFHFYAA